MTLQEQIAKYKEMVACEPEMYVLERTFCSEAGKDGHNYCGICTDHNKPRFICGCYHSNQSEI